jgi:hypothetical protein
MTPHEELLRAAPPPVGERPLSPHMWQDTPRACLQIGAGYERELRFS